MLPLTLTYIHTDTQPTPVPTNRPILPFLVLTMAGGCWVSNLMKQQLSVCGNGGWREGGRGGRRGWVKTQVSLSELWPEWKRERGSCMDHNNQSKMAAGQRSRERDSDFFERESPPPLVLGWLVWVHARSFRRAGRWFLTPESSAELSDSEASSLLEEDSKALNSLLLSPYFHRSVWLGGRIRAGLPTESLWTTLCVSVCKGQIQCNITANMVDGGGALKPSDAFNNENKPLNTGDSVMNQQHPEPADWM